VSDTVLIRPLERADGHALRFAFDQLSERSRYQRFLGFAPHLSELQLRRLMAVDHWHHEALIAYASGQRRPVGIARYVRGGEFDLAEVAVEVADDWQRRAVGRALVVELAVAARAAGVRRFSATLLTDNRAALRLAQLAGPTRVRRGGGGVLEVAVELYASGPGDPACLTTQDRLVKTLRVG